jgi:hypothetical protein
MQVDKDIAGIRALYEVLESNQQFDLNEAKKLGIVPAQEPLTDWYKNRMARACMPLLAS